MLSVGVDSDQMRSGVVGDKYHPIGVSRACPREDLVGSGQFRHGNGPDHFAALTIDLPQFSPESGEVIRHRPLPPA